MINNKNYRPHLVKGIKLKKAKRKYIMSGQSSVTVSYASRVKRKLKGSNYNGLRDLRPSRLDQELEKLSNLKFSLEM